MASLSWPWEPLEPGEELHINGCVLPYGHRGRCLLSLDDAAYDAEEADTVTARAYYEANRDIEPQMETWRADQ